ncbi:MAG: hypothetical protein JWL77_1716 [Chthonomonadaceae bacterium]|nr:hypothetical protein [Chthonomonadaceae bacterium]
MLKLGAGHHRGDLSEALVGACGAARGGPSYNRADLKVVNLLLRHGADPDGPDDDRGGPLLRALLCDGDGSKIVRVLLRQGVSVNIPDERGITPLMVAATQDINTVRLLLRHGANPNTRSEDGRTPLNSVSSQAGSDPIRRLLMEAGAKN